MSTDINFCLKNMQRLLTWRCKALFRYRTFDFNHININPGCRQQGPGNVKVNDEKNRSAECYHCQERVFTTTSCVLQTKKTHYEVLNVKQTAPSSEIRDAFLNLSKECHPDLNMQNDPEDNHKKFVALNEAYTVLSKPSSRRDYDLTLRVHRQLQRHSNYPAYRSHGYQADSPHYHHPHRSHVDWDGTSTSSQTKDDFQRGRRLHRNIVNYYSLTAFFTIAFVGLVMGYKDYIVPMAPKRSLQSQNGFNKHDYIMSSTHEGQTVLYYAVPDNENPDKFKVLAFLKKEVEGDPDDFVLEELNGV